MRKQVLTLLVISMVALAGCSAVPFGGGNGAQDKTAKQPVPLSEVSYPQGASESSVNGTLLYQTHMKQMENATFKESIHLNTPNSTLTAKTVKGQQDKHIDITAGKSSIEIWDTPNQTHMKRATQQGNQYTTLGGNSLQTQIYGNYDRIARNKVLGAIFGTVEAKATNAYTKNDVTYINYNGTVKLPENKTAPITFTITTEGTIKSASFTSGGFEFQYSVSKLGTANPEKPSWMNKFPATNAQYNAEKNVVTVSNAGTQFKQPVDVTVQYGKMKTNATITDTPMYVYVQNNTVKTTSTLSEVPSDAETLKNSVVVQTKKPVTLADGSRYVFVLQASPNTEKKN